MAAQRVRRRRPGAPAMRSLRLLPGSGSRRVGRWRHTAWAACVGRSAGLRRLDDRPHPAQARRHARRTSRSSAAKRRSSSSRPSASIPTWVALRGQRCCGHAASASAPSSAFRSARRPPDVKHYEARRAIFDGAAEIDMVINIGALKSGDLRAGRARHRRGRRRLATKRASSARSSSKPRF